MILIDDCGNKIISHDLYINVHDPVIANERKWITANAVIFQNTGTNTAHIFKNFDIPPGAIHMIGSQTDPNRINQEIDISFTGAGTNNLQIMTLHMRIPGINDK